MRSPVVARLRMAAAGVNRRRPGRGRPLSPVVISFDVTMAEACQHSMSSAPAGAEVA